MSILSFVVICYVLLCMGVVIFKILHNIKNTKKTNVPAQTNEELLRYMNEQHIPAEYANAFVRLVKQDYVLVHTMGNNGNKYNDELQEKRYSSNFTAEVARGINDLKGKYV